ncbi:ATP-dependent RNA helicase HrpA [Pasteurella canis]|nr:ATP-dependent RNA helicase HrpA [Pasteurella canis]
MRYRPVVETEEQDQLQAILDAVDELQTEGRGDILIFMNGEREIRDTAEALQKQDLKHTEILPLFARLSAQEQNKIFNPSGLNRIVLATNVAETSLTVPGIKYVIDPGTARISRYSYRTKVQRLPIEPISQASANQRKGRCGRVSEGICIRLYSEDDFNSRPEFTDPEILRTNLASVIYK